jgi:hypothetical protein
MALVTTTLSAAVASTDASITVASATSIVAGRIIQIDGERMVVTRAYVNASTTVPVLRGQGGTQPRAHANSGNVTHGDPSDFAADPPQASAGLPMPVTMVFDSYSASGAISFGQARLTIAQLIGTSTLAMTIAAPDKSLDGYLLMVIGNAKSQSTVATATTVGFGNAGASYDTFTFQNAGNLALFFVACNGFWNILNTPITGTSTALSVAIA